jgi:hypothetical protein
MDRMVGKRRKLDLYTYRIPGAVQPRGKIIDGVMDVHGKIQNSPGSHHTNELVDDRQRLLGVVNNIVTEDYIERPIFERQHFTDRRYGNRVLLQFWKKPFIVNRERINTDAQVLAKPEYKAMRSTSDFKNSVVAGDRSDRVQPLPNDL